MLTKGTIVEIINEYSAKVRIPLYDLAEGVSGATSNENLCVATICSLSNASDLLSVGDVVYIGFEDNDKSRPVILGHLMCKTKNKSYPTLTVNNLEVKGNTTISSNMQIGDVTGKDLLNLVNPNYIYKGNSNTDQENLLRDKEGKIIYPQTKTSNVSDNYGNNLDTLLNNKVDKTSTANQLYATDSSGNQTTRTIKELNTFDDLGWEDSTNQHKIPDISTIAFWDGAYDNNKGSNLEYCKGGRIASKDSQGNVQMNAMYSNGVKSYTDVFWNYSGQRCVHVGTLKAGWDNHTIGGRIYTHNGYNINDRTQRIIDFNITIGNDGNGTSTVQGFAIRTQGESAGYEWGSEAIYLVKTSSTTWEMYYVMAAWSDAVFEMIQGADSNNDFYFTFDSAHDNFVTEPTTYDLKIVPINNDPPKLEIDNNWGVVTGGSRSWYAAWRIEIPVRQNGVTRMLKVIGGFTPSEEGQKTVNFRMVWDTNNDVFSTDCLGFYSVGIRNGSTANGWQYATWNKSAATVTQISSGSVWFAIGY